MKRPPTFRSGCWKSSGFPAPLISMLASAYNPQPLNMISPIPVLSFLQSTQFVDLSTCPPQRLSSLFVFRQTPNIGDAKTSWVVTLIHCCINCSQKPESNLSVYSTKESPYSIYTHFSAYDIWQVVKSSLIVNPRNQMWDLQDLGRTGKGNSHQQQDSKRSQLEQNNWTPSHEVEWGIQKPNAIRSSSNHIHYRTQRRCTRYERGRASPCHVVIHNSS